MSPLSTFEQTFEEMKQRVDEAVDQAGIAPELKKQLRALVQSVIAKLDLVPREEFDAQAKVLANTRRRLEELEQEVNALLQHLEQPEDSEQESSPPPAK